MTKTFREIKDKIRNDIIAGTWKPRELIPNEADLAAEFGCARTTVNRAIRELAEEGLVERKRKAGTRVLNAPRRRAQFEIPIIRNEIEALGQSYGYDLISREVTPVPGWLQEPIGLEKRSKVLHLTCRHLTGSTPYQFEDRWINLAAMPEAETADFTSLVPTEWLIEAVPFSDVEISFSATAADAAVASSLHCAEGTPLFMTERTTWWQGQAITYVRLIFRPGHKMTTRY